MSDTTISSVPAGHIIGGKYRVVRELGRGAMGDVVLAVHVALDKRVAIKLIRPQLANDARAIARFLREGRAAARITSPHVVRVIDVESESGTPYMVMEYLDGQDLGRYLDARYKLPVREAVDLVLQACAGVEAAHRRGVVHRDLKPANLFLARDAEGGTTLKVVDFGVSKLAPRGRPEASLTTSSLPGTPVYMSPEQLRGHADARADVWALGSILFELLTGQTPFEARTIAKLCMKIASLPAPRASQLTAEVPRGLDDAIERALAKNADERFQTAAALAQAIAPFGSGDVVIEVETTPATTSLEARAPRSVARSADPMAATTPSRERRRRFHRRMALTAVLTIVALVACGLAARIVSAQTRSVRDHVPRSTSARSMTASSSGVENGDSRAAM